MSAKKIIISSIVAGIAVLAISMAVSAVAQMFFQYDVLALGGMRAVTDPIMALFFLHPWVVAFTMAIAYGPVSKGLQGSWMQKGKKFGLLVWIVAAIPSAFIVYASMDYPIGFTVSSLVGSLLYIPAAGIIIAKLME